MEPSATTTSIHISKDLAKRLQEDVQDRLNSNFTAHSITYGVLLRAIETSHSNAQAQTRAAMDAKSLQLKAESERRDAEEKCSAMAAECERLKAAVEEKEKEALHWRQQWESLSADVDILKRELQRAVEDADHNRQLLQAEVRSRSSLLQAMQDDVTIQHAAVTAQRMQRQHAAVVSATLVQDERRDTGGHYSMYASADDTRQDGAPSSVLRAQSSEGDGRLSVAPSLLSPPPPLNGRLHPDMTKLSSRVQESPPPRATTTESLAVSSAAASCRLLGPGSMASGRAAAVYPSSYLSPPPHSTSTVYDLASTRDAMSTNKQHTTVTVSAVSSSTWQRGSATAQTMSPRWASAALPPSPAAVAPQTSVSAASCAAAKRAPWVVAR